MNETQVTLVAALIAAGVSIISLFGDIFSTWQGELRATHRTALEPFLAELGSTIDALLTACLHYNEQIEAGSPSPTSLAEVTQIAHKLQEIRAKVKYPLWGVDPGLETLIHLPRWLADWATDAQARKRLLADAQRLRHLLDDTIRLSYHAGRPPTLWQTWQVKASARLLEQGWGQSDSPMPSRL